MAMRLDRDEAVFLAVLMEMDPGAGSWVAPQDMRHLATSYGASGMATGSPEGAFAVCRRLTGMGLLEREHRGFRLTLRGREELRRHRERHPLGEEVWS